MKTKLYLLIILMSCLSITSKAQLRVLQNGRVQVGTLRLDGEDPLNVNNNAGFDLMAICVQDRN